MRTHLVRSLLSFLACGAPQRNGWWHDWQIAGIAGGRNNLLYRASGPDGDLDIKFTIRDGRDRAGREYGALTALRQAGLSIAPEPILLDRTRYFQPVVVQSWLEGVVGDTPPETDDDWEKLAQHLASVHTVTPDRTRMQLPWATINANTAAECVQRVREQMAHIPGEAQPISLAALLGRLEVSRIPE